MKCLFKWSLYLIATITNFNVVANDNNAIIENTHTLVISHDYSTQQTLKASSPFLKENRLHDLHGVGKFDTEILGENEKIILHNMQEVFVYFSYGKFGSVYLHPFPRNHWFPLEEAKTMMENIRNDISNIKKISTKYEEFNLDDITYEYMLSHTRAGAGIYYLNNYERLVIVLRKLDTPQALHPRETDVFQVHVVLERKMN